MADDVQQGNPRGQMIHDSEQELYADDADDEALEDFLR